MTIANWKRIPCKTVVLFVAAWVLAPNTIWAQAIPATAGAFATYCTPLKKGCDGKIQEVETDAEVKAMTSSPPIDACTVPKGIEFAAGDRAIVAWLSAHPSAADMSTADGINAAIKALWNCQKSVATGVTSWGVPDKTGPFVAFCADAKHYTKCASEIVQASVNAYAAQTLNGKSLHCTSPDNVGTKELTAKVLAWLNGHKEVYGLATEDGNAAAIDHLWPCH